MLTQTPFPLRSDSDSDSYPYHHDYYTDRDSDSAKPRLALHIPLRTSLDFLCSPAFTESSWVACKSQAFQNSVGRCDGGLDKVQTVYSSWDPFFHDRTLCADMDSDIADLRRSGSHHSNSSQRSHRSSRTKARRYASYMSSAASSISDKSLTSFPQFSPEGSRCERPERPERTSSLPPADGTVRRSISESAPSIHSLTASSPTQARRSLFDDAPVGGRSVPGSIHLANDEHIQRLIARNGAIQLIRQIAGDLAQRDSQISMLRRKAEERERALRRIILECGLSNLDLETRLRVIEEQRREARVSQDTVVRGGLEDLMSDAMNASADWGEDSFEHAKDNEATIRAREPDKPAASRGWKDYLWGGASRKTSRAISTSTETVTPTGTRNGSRPSVLHNEMFTPPGSVSRTASRKSSNTSLSAPAPRRASGFATLALKLVAGNAAFREGDNEGRGRANSIDGSPPRKRTVSQSSANTTHSARPAPKAVPRKISRKSVPTSLSGEERWDTMLSSPQDTAMAKENYGPVEMDTILPLDAQPPTLIQYSKFSNPEYLTDRFGFIYDQRRKKRQREAAERTKKTKRGSRVEMLSGARSSIGIVQEEGSFTDDDRPATPHSMASIESTEDAKTAKRWQDYLKIATFPTELLSHTPAGSMPVFEIMEGGEVPSSPRFAPEEDGFLPAASSSAAPPAISKISDNGTLTLPATTKSPPGTATLPQEDAEPVKLLLEQLGEVHDSLQRDKTVRWNEFLRKVRAERKREGQAAAAALDPRSRTVVIMPEATLADGEMIGISGLGNKGKVGRAKWAEFKTLVLGGIPVAYRAKIWAECSGALSLRIPGYYEDLANREGEDDPTIVSQIDMDINRTLTDNIFFRKGPGVSKLNEVLLAYSRRNPEVGYCQGMNLITACLLLIMPTAEDAFWVLTSIIEHTLPRGYYDHSLLASRADQVVLRQYVADILPNLSAHLDDLSIELEALTFQWFLSVFTDCLSAEALFRVWDVVFCTNDGSTFLFQVALALLKLNEKQLLQCTNPAAVYTYINHQMTNHAISIDGLIHASEGLRKVVKREDIESRRVKAIEAEKDLAKEREVRNKARRAERLAKETTDSSSSTETSTLASSHEVQEEGEEVEESEERLAEA